MAGEGATWHEDQLVPITRHGRREDVWWTYGYSPIDDETQPGGVGGVLVVCNDVTDQHYAVDALRASEERLQLVDRIQHLVPTPDGGDDFVGIGCPVEGLRI
ncbi:PAS/PAC sensor hybrid histidine kinase [alpha proteobacterium BAL199]|nr:PAS/PAC sensor hybrid histidine kinase [alpha proteobacterium BAL199]